MALGYLPLLLASLAGASWADAETVNVERRGAVDLAPALAPALTLGVLMTAELALGRRTQTPRSASVPAPTVTAS